MIRGSTVRQGLSGSLQVRGYGSEIKFAGAHLRRHASIDSIYVGVQLSGQWRLVVISYDRPTSSLALCIFDELRDIDTRGFLSAARRVNVVKGDRLPRPRMINIAAEDGALPILRALENSEV